MSKVAALIGELRRLGVALWHEGDRLRYRAPPGVITPELLDRLKVHKESVRSFLTGAADVAKRGAEEVAIERVAAATAPLSFAQERLWFLSQLEGREEPAAAAYNVCAALRLRGALDEAALRNAVGEVVRRHAILRTRFMQSHEGPLQVIEPRGAALEVADLTARPEAVRTEAARAFIEAEAARAFALEAAPPVRFILARLDSADHLLACVLHHIVTDGWSMGVLLAEISALYGAFASGAASPLAELPLQYADYAVHQRRALGGEALAPALAYWRERMTGAPAVIDLPLDRARSARQSYRGALVRFELEPALAQSLKVLAQERGATLFMVLLAGYAALLARHSGQVDVVIGTPVANRDTPEVESLIGVLSNYIPLRVDLGGDPTVDELIRRVRALTLEGYAQQHLPFEKIVEAARPEREPGVAPLFQVALVLQNLPPSAGRFPGLEATAMTIDRATAKLDLSLLFEEAGGAIRGELEYSTDLFEADTAARLARQLAMVLEAFHRDPACRLSRLALLASREERDILERWSGTHLLRCEDGVVHERFREQAARTPEAVALVAAGERLTYAELACRASRLARHLAALGVAPEDRVAVCLPRSASLVAALLAVLEAGGAYVPLDASHPPERLAGIVADSGAKVVVTVAQLLARLPVTLCAVCVDRDAATIERRDPHPLGRRACPGQLAYVIYTSGSTGRPKGVMVEHRAVASLVRALADAVYARHHGPIDVALVASTAFDASVQQIFGALLLGHTLHVVDDDTRQDAARLLDFLDAHGITLCDGTPSLLALLLDAGLGARPASRLEHLLIGGEALPSRLIERLRAADVHGRIAVTNLYGPTECGVDDTFRTVAPGERLRGAHVPIGRPLSNARVHILDAEGAPVPIGMRGDIWIGGPCLARGYLGEPRLTAEAYRPDPFVAESRLYASGDRGRWIATGEIEFLGRGDDQLKVRGFRVEPTEVESTLLQHPAVRDAVVVIDRSGEEPARLVAYVTLREPAPTVMQLRDHLEALLPAYMVPSAFMLVGEVPLNASGKVDRARLIGGAARELSQGVAYVKPGEPRELALAAAWSRVLGRESIGAADHFFALGGDSIKALQVASRLRQSGWRLELRDLFVHPTLAALAARLEPLAPAAAQAPATDGEMPLAPVQAAFLHDHPGPKHHFHQALLIAPAALVDVHALNLALAAVFAHHEALRMRFQVVDGIWHQAIGPASEPPVAEVLDLARAEDPRAAMRAHASSRMSATDLALGPLFLAALYRLPEGERLLLAAHHLVVDGVSWRILVEDLATAYAQALAGVAASLPPVSDAYARWAGAMAELGAGLPEDERDYWRRAETSPCASLPLDRPEMRPCRRDRAERRIELAGSVTEKLLSTSHEAYGTRMDDLLLTALARALAAWGGARRWRVLLESHGRQPMWKGADVTRTVGWFTARYPVLLDLEGAEDAGLQIKRVKEMLRQVPRGGGGYEAARQHAAGEPLPAITFNYLGQLGGDLRADGWAWVDEDAGSVVAPEARLVHDLEIMGFVAAGRLRLAIAYGRGRISDAAIERLAAGLEREITHVVEHASGQKGRSLTPSDIDYDGFDIEALDAFVNDLQERR